MKITDVSDSVVEVDGDQPQLCWTFPNFRELTKVYSQSRWSWMGRALFDIIVMSPNADIMCQKFRLIRRFVRDK